jgi:hypothetical protein
LILSSSISAKGDFFGPPLLANAAAKAEVFRERYAILYQVLFDIGLFDTVN